MTSVAPAVMAAIIVAMPPGVVTVAEIGCVYRAPFPRRQNHAPNDEYDNSCEYQQQDCEMRQSTGVHSNLARPCWQLHSKERMDVMAHGEGSREKTRGRRMSLMPAPGMSAATVERTAAIAAGTGAGGAGNGLTVRRILWRGQKHLPQREHRDASKHQQQHAKMHPTGRVHLGPLPRSGHQFRTTERT